MLSNGCDRCDVVSLAPVRVVILANPSYEKYFLRRVHPGVPVDADTSHALVNGGERRSPSTVLGPGRTNGRCYNSRMPSNVSRGKSLRIFLLSRVRKQGHFGAPGTSVMKGFTAFECPTRGSCVRYNNPLGTVIWTCSGFGGG